MYHVAYCFDANYQQHFAASLSSLVANLGDEPRHLTVHIVTDNPEEKLKRFLNEFALSTGISIETHCLLASHLALLDKIPQKFRNLKGYLSLSAYFRIMIPDILPKNIDNILYLDSDTIIISDIVEILSISLEGKPIGAVVDVDSKVMSEAHGISEYYNSGVMLMDLQSLRALDFSRKCLNFMWDENNKSLTADQCAINVVMADKIKSLPRKWNRYVSNNEFSISRSDEVIKDAAIIHYITSQKPWHAWYENRLGALYWNSVRASGWPNPVEGPAKTVADYHRLARKLGKQGQFEDALSAYETLVTHLRQARAEPSNAA